MGFNILENNLLMFIGINLLNAILISGWKNKFRLQKRYLQRLLSEAESMTHIKSKRWTDYYFGLLLPYFFMIGTPIYLVWCLNSTILFSIILTLGCIMFNIFFSYLRSISSNRYLFEKDTERYPFQNKSTKDVHEDAILQYVRVTLLKNDQIIFDSSDYIQINTYFGTFETIQPSLTVGARFPIKNPTYKIVAVRADFLYIFDDYSNFGTTEQYTGRKIPYNIQIFADVQDISDK